MLLVNNHIVSFSVARQRYALHWMLSCYIRQVNRVNWRDIMWCFFPSFLPCALSI